MGKIRFLKKSLMSVLSVALLITGFHVTNVYAESALTIESKDGEVNETVLYGQLKSMYGDAIGTLDQAEFSITRKSDNAAMITGLTLTNAPDTTFTNDTYVVSGKKGVNKWVQTGKYPWQGENQVTWSDLDTKEFNVRVYHEITAEALTTKNTVMPEQAAGIALLNGPNIDGGNYTDYVLNNGTVVNIFEDSNYTIKANDVTGYKFVSLNSASEKTSTLDGNTIKSNGIKLVYEMLPCDVVFGTILDTEGNPVAGRFIVSGMTNNQIAKNVAATVTVQTDSVWYELVSISVVDTNTNEPLTISNQTFSASENNNSVTLSAVVKTVESVELTIDSTNATTTIQVKPDTWARLEKISENTYKVQPGSEYQFISTGKNVDAGNGFTVTGGTLNENALAGNIFTAVNGTNNLKINTAEIKVSLTDVESFKYWENIDTLIDSIGIEMQFEGLDEKGNNLVFADIAKFGVLNTKIDNLPDIAKYAMLADGTYSTTINVKSPDKYSLSLTNDQIIAAIRENPKQGVVLNAIYTETEDPKYKPIVKEAKADIWNVYYRVPVSITSENPDFTGGKVTYLGDEYADGDTIKMMNGMNHTITAVKNGAYRVYVNGVADENVIIPNNDTKVEVIYTLDSVVVRKDVENGSMSFIGVDGNPQAITVKAGEAVNVLISPDNSGSQKYYVKSAWVVKNSQVEGFDEQIDSVQVYENDSLKVSFNTETDRSNEYKVWAEIAPAKLVLNADQTLNWNKFEQDKFNENGNLKETLFKLLVNKESSVPSNIIFDDNIKIEYLVVKLPESISGISLGSLGGNKYVELTGSINDINAKVESLENDIVKGLEALSKLGINIDIDSLLEEIHPFGYAEKETVKVSWNGEGTESELKNTYPSLTAETTLNIIDVRTSTSINANNFSFTYGDNPSHDELVKLANVKVTDENGKTVTCADTYIEFNKELSSLDAGEYEVNVSFAGDETYKNSKTSITVTINKAKATVAVNPVSSSYGENYELDYDVVPSKVDHITIIAGVQGDVSGYISIHMPQSVKDLLDRDITIGGTTFNPYNELTDALETSLTNRELKEKLNDILNKVTANSDIDLSFINKILSILDANPDKTALTIVSDEKPTNAGVYAVVVVTVDKNYETAYGINYLTIAPKKGEVKFNKVDDNNVFKYLSAQSYDFGSAFYVDGQKTETKHLQNLFVGVTYDEDGNEIGTYSSAEAPRIAGMYTQTAIVAGGNYYSDAITRTYVILPESLSGDATSIKVEITPDSKVLHTTDYDIVTTLFDKNDKEIEGEVIVKYIGLNATGDIIYNSAEKPTAVGVYQVIATYKGEPNKYLPAINAEKSIIIYREPTHIDIQIEKTEIEYDGLAHGVVAEVLNSHDEYVTDATVKYIGVDINNVEFYNSTEMPVAPGFYTAIATYAGDAKHLPALNAQESFVIHKEAAILMIPPYQIVKYDGNPHGVTAIVVDYKGNEIEGATAEIQYVEITDNAEVKMDNAPVLPGNYKAIATYVGNKDTVTATATIKIYEQSTYTRISPNLTNVMYDGLSHKVTAEVYNENHELIADSTNNPDEVTITYYSLTDEEYVDAPVDAGIYHVTAKYEGNNILYGSSNVLGVMMIKPSTAIIKVKLGNVTSLCGDAVKALSINEVTLEEFNNVMGFAGYYSANVSLPAIYTGLAERDVAMIISLDNISHDGLEDGENEHAVILEVSDMAKERLKRNYINELEVVNGTHTVKHHYSHIETVKPDCEEKGYDIHTCSCGESYKDNYTNELGHDYGDWKTIEHATCDKSGYAIRECKHEGCTHSEKKILAKLTDGCVIPGNPVEPDKPSQGTVNERPDSGVLGDNLVGLIAGSTMIGLGIIGLFLYFLKKKKEDNTNPGQ